MEAAARGETVSSLKGPSIRRRRFGRQQRAAKNACERAPPCYSGARFIYSVRRSRANPNVNKQRRESRASQLGRWCSAMAWAICCESASAGRGPCPARAPRRPRRLRNRPRPSAAAAAARRPALPRRTNAPALPARGGRNPLAKVRPLRPKPSRAQVQKLHTWLRKHETNHLNIQHETKTLPTTNFDSNILAILAGAGFLHAVFIMK